MKGQDQRQEGNTRTHLNKPSSKMEASVSAGTGLPKVQEAPVGVGNQHQNAIPHDTVLTTTKSRPVLQSRGQHGHFNHCSLHPQAITCIPRGLTLYNEQVDLIHRYHGKVLMHNGLACVWFDTWVSISPFLVSTSYSDLPCESWEHWTGLWPRPGSEMATRPCHFLMTFIGLMKIPHRTYDRSSGSTRSTTSSPAIGILCW
jgi:hypothetical protein